MSGSDINLIQKHSGPVREISLLEDKLHVASWWALGVLFLLGVGIGGAFVYEQSTISRLEADKVSYVRKINQQSDKEGILLSLKDRTAIAAKALGSAKPWGSLFPLMSKISAGGFNTISVEETGRVTTEMTLASLDEAVLVVTNIMLLAQDKSIRSPQLQSFLIGENGQIRLGVTFVPIF